MATWVDIAESTYKERFYCPYQGGSSASYMPYITLQYDSSTITPVSCTFRFKFIKTGTNGPTDMFYILLNPTTTSRDLFPLKTWHGQDKSKWPIYSNKSFTVTKTHTAATFTIPAYWICNDGNDNTADDATSFYNQYNDNAWRGQQLRRTVSAQNISVLSSSTVAADVGTGTTTIVDNYNNKFKINATKGGNGTNNTAGGPTSLSYGYTTAYGTSYTSGTLNNLTLSGTGNTRTVYARSITTATYGNDKTSTTSLAVRQYRAPNDPTNLTIDNSSYKNGRLTIKQDWKFTWTASTPGTGSGTTNGTGSNQTTSRVMGYKITLQKKTAGSSSFTSFAIKNSSGSTLSDSSNNYYANITALTFSPLKSGIVAGDTVKIIIKPYTQYGLNNDGDYLWGNEVSYTTQVVQNAGVMRVKPTASSGWKEGVVWVKVNKNGTPTWVEADIVKTKVSSGWKEST